MEQELNYRKNEHQLALSALKHRSKTKESKMAKILLMLGLFAVQSLVAVTAFADPSAGPGAGGGGNLVRGKMIESYIIAPEKIPGFDGLAAQLATLGSTGDSKSLLEGILKRKVWYLIPGPLEQLPASRIGSAVAGEQAALQDFSAVWIDQDLLKTMPAQQQSELLLHEILMGFRLVKFDSSFHQCQLIVNHEWWGGCENHDMIPRGAPSDLKAADYDSIRVVVRTLMDNPQPTTKEFNALMRDQDFAFAGAPFKDEIKERRAQAEDLLQAFRTAELAEDWPSYAYTQPQVFERMSSPSVWRMEATPYEPVSRCHFKLALSANKKSFTLTIHADHQDPFIVHVKKLQNGDIGYYPLDAQGNDLGNPQDDTHPSKYVALPIGGKIVRLNLYLINTGIDTFYGKPVTRARLDAVYVETSVKVDGALTEATLRTLLCSKRPVWDGPR
jgi:hypothetical protein